MAEFNFDAYLANKLGVKPEDLATAAAPVQDATPSTQLDPALAARIGVNPADLNLLQANPNFNKHTAKVSHEQVPNPFLPNAPAPDSKAAEVAQATQDKVQQLAAINATKPDTSWDAKLGLDPKGLLGTAVNMAAVGVDGAINIEKTIATSVHALRAAAVNENVPGIVKAARERQLAGQATDSDLQLLALPAGDTTANPKLTPYQAIAREDAKNSGTLETNLDRIQRMESAVQDMRTVRNVMDSSSIVNHDRQNAVEGDLRAGFKSDLAQAQKGWDAAKNGDVLSGVGNMVAGGADMVANIGRAAANNPIGATEYMVSNAPQLALSATPAGAVLVNGAYAADQFGKGIEASADRNGGAMPSDAELASMAGKSTAAGALEYMGNLAVLGKGVAGKMLGKAIEEQAAQQAVRTGLKEALLGAPARTLVHAGEAGAEEFATEALQTGLENSVEGKAVTPEDMYVGGAIGAMAGAGNAGGLHGFHEAAHALSSNGSSDTSATTAAASASASPASVPVTRKEQAAAVQSGDVATMADPASPKYAPEKAVSALLGNSQLDTTPVETKQANLQQASKIVSDLQDSYDAGRQQLDAMPKDAAERPALVKQLQAMDKQLGTAQDALIALHEDFAKSAAPAAAVKAQIDTLASPVDTNDAQAVQQHQDAADAVINLAMAAPEQLDPQVAAKLSTNPALTDAQRSYLRSFSESRIQSNMLKDMGKVSQEIYAGSPEHIGIEQYRARMGAALAAGNQSQADRQLSGMDSFVQSHQGKAAAALQAYQTAPGTQIVRATDGTWQTQPADTMTQQQLRKNGGLAINSPKLVSSIGTEASALTAAQKEMQAAYALKFSNGGNHVQNQPSAALSQGQQQSATQVAPVSAPVQAAANSAVAGQSGVAAGNTAQKAAVQSTEEHSGSTASTVDAQSTDSTQSSQLSSGQMQSNAEHSVNAPAKASETPVETASAPANVDSQQHQGGALSVMQDKSDGSKPFNERNLVADFFTQSASREGDATSRPLVAVKDFLSSVVSGEKSITDFLKDKELTDNQRAAWNGFVAKAQAWAGTIQGNLFRRTDPKFYFRDMMQFLLTEQNGKPAVDENVKTAIAYGAFAHVAETALRDVTNSDEEINAILGRDEHALVDDTERKALGGIGTRQNVVVNSLGQKVAQALGLKASQDAPRDLQPKLESALGAHALKLLLDEGLLERHTVSGREMAQLTGNPNTDKKASFQFIRLGTNAQVDEVSAANRGSQGVLDKLFSVEPGLKEPSKEPVPFTQKTTKNTNQQVPAVLAKILEKMNATPYYVRQDMHQLMTQLSENIAHQIAGAVDADPSTVHGANLASVKAKNDGLVREFSRFMDHVGTMVDITDAMYFEHSVWKQQRVGIATNVINPQTSKIHRHMLYQGPWDTKVEMNDAAQMDNFRLRVLEGLGTKTDKQSNLKSLASFKAKVGDPTIADAVKVLQKAITLGGITEAEQATLLAGVSAGGENMHSLDALMALAHYENAKADNQPHFNVQLMGEVDGVTNGPMLSHLLMGAAPTVNALFDLLNRGGFYQEGNDQSQYNLWRNEPGHLDLYENTALHMTQAVNAMLAKNPKLGVVLDAVYGFTGTLADKDGTVLKAGRNIIKTPLTAMVFGSAVSAALDSMANKFIESIYAGIEDAASGKSKTSARDLVSNINLLLAHAGAEWTQAKTIGDLMKADVFSPAQINGLKKAFKTTLGKAVETTMGQDFASYINQRGEFNLAAQTTFSLYNAAYTGMRDAYITEQIKAGKIAVNSKNEPIHDLTAAQERELQSRLKALTPIMQTAMGKDSGQLSAGLAISKSSRKISQDSPYEGEIRFGTKFADNGAATTMTRSYETAQTAPGVAMLPMGTHSTDSAISHYAADGHPVLNVHDAHGAGLSNFQNAAQNLNTQTWNAMLNYSPAGEMHAALSRTMTGLAQLMEQGNLPQQVQENLAAAIQELAAKQDMAPQEFIQNILASTKELAYRADDMKLQALSQMGAIDQYALEGGNYQVTDADRKAASDARAALSQGLSAEESAAVQKIAEALAPALSGEKATFAQDPEMDASVSRSDVLQIPAVQAAQLLEHGAQDQSLPDALRQQMRDVLDAMANGAKTLKVAVLERLKGADAANLVQILSQRLKSLPSGVWGDTGTSVMASDPKLVQFFEANPEPKADRVLHGLYRQIAAMPESRNRDFQLQLVKLLNKTVDPNLSIRYVTPATSESLVLDKPTTKARGWYVAKNGAEEIYVLSPDFVHSGLTMETLLHELTHAALARVIERELQAKAANAGYTSDALSLIDELNVLRGKAQELVDSRANLQGQFAPALANIHEFVTWGMTNRGFQQNVLNQLSMETKNSGNALANGLKDFIAKITGILFRGSMKSAEERNLNGMTALVTNVAGLFNQAAQVKDSTDLALNLAQAATNTAPVESFSTQDIYTALDTGAVTPSFGEHLQGLLGGIVEKLHGPFGAFAEAAKKDAVATPLDAWANALATGVAPFASKSMASGFTISNQEAFVLEQVEATVKAALDSKEAHGRSAYKLLSGLYQEAYARLKPEYFHNGDWSMASADEKARAQALYNFVFKLEQSNGDRSDYLARFAALGLAHEGFSQILQTPTDTRVTGGAMSLGERLQTMFENALEVFQSKVTGTYAGQNMDAKLANLVDQLVNIEAKRRGTLESAFAGTFLAPAEKITRDLTKMVEDAFKLKKDQLLGLANSTTVRASNNAFVRATGAMARTWSENRVEQMVEGINRIRNEHFKGMPGVAISLMNDVRGQSEKLVTLLRTVTKRNEQMRKAIIDNTAKAVLSAFADNGSTMTKAEKAAVTQVFLRTGAHFLLDHYDMAQLHNLVSDKTALNAAVADFESRVNAFPDFARYFKEQANVLGYFKATGKVKDNFLMMNARNIASLTGTEHVGHYSAAETGQIASHLEALTALYALRYTDRMTQLQAREVLRTENLRTDGNGVEFLLKAHRQFEQESRARLFGDNPTLMMHGFTPEMFNPYTQITFAGAEQGKDLTDLGYVRGAPIQQDRMDPNPEERHIYVLRDGGLMPYQSGIFSLTSKQARGTRMFNDSMIDTLAGEDTMPMVEAITQRKLDAVSSLYGPSTAPVRDLSTVNGTFSAPILNEQGEVVNWRYLMNDDTKNSLLERNNDFSQITGMFAGSIFDKQTAPEQNRQLVEALHEQFRADYAQNPNGYLRVGPDSQEEYLRDMWRMLPASTRTDIRKVWGRDGLYVKKEAMDLVFGYRKLSAADILRKDPEARSHMEKLFAGLVEWNLHSYARAWLGMNAQQAATYAKQAAVKVTRAERMWQEIVRETKNNIVVKSLSVMWNNVRGNISQLLLRGVSVKDILNGHLVALRGATQYQQDSAQLAELQLQRKGGYGDMAALDRKITVLQDSLARNPVKELVDAGLMPTIADPSATENPYSYKSAFVRKTEAFTSKLNPKVTALGKVAYMAKNTTLYQGLAHMNQLGDFMARYTLYQHLISRQENPMSKADAAHRASEDFINYDVPMHRMVQYTDDMGVTMFTKYFLRIQRVISSMFKDKPASVLGMLALSHYIDLGETVLNASAFKHLGRNPVSNGIFQYPGSVGEIGTVKALGHAMKLMQ